MRPPAPPKLVLSFLEIALGLLAPAGIALAADTPAVASPPYTLWTIFQIAGACAGLTATVFLFFLKQKNRELRERQEEVNRLRSELDAISITDSITGLFNRRYMDAQLKMALSYARRQHVPVSIAIAGIDLFKSISDTQGHQRGELILKGVATAIKSVLRDEDIACRYSEEEFMLILPSTTLAGAVQCAERLRAKVEADMLAGLKVTLSVGVASTETHADLTAEDLIASTGKALSAAKNHGRNVVLSEADDIGAMPMRSKQSEPHQYIY